MKTGPFYGRRRSKQSSGHEIIGILWPGRQICLPALSTDPEFVLLQELQHFDIVEEASKAQLLERWQKIDQRKPGGIIDAG